MTYSWSIAQLPFHGHPLLRNLSDISLSGLALSWCHSSSAVFISICAEHLPNELHSIGDRRVEWLNPGALEPDHLGSVMIRLHRTGCDLRQVNQGL